MTFAEIAIMSLAAGFMFMLGAGVGFLISLWIVERVVKWLESKKLI